MKVKVLHYAPGFMSGGIESRLVDWYTKIDREKVEFVLIKLNSDDKSPKLQEFRELGGRCYNLPKFTPFNYIKYRKEMRKIFLEEQFDVVHVHSLSTGIFPLKEAKKQGVAVRVIHSRTTNYLPNEKNRLIKEINRLLTANYATHYFACSKQAAEWGVGKKKAREATVIKNGIQLEKFIYNEDVRNRLRIELGLENNYVVGTVCRLTPQKNLLFSLEVFDKIKRKIPSAKYVIVGKGPEYEPMMERASQLGIRNDILFCGEQSDVFNFYMAFDCFLATSLYEGFGTTAIEAQATGLPTLLSEGFPKVVEITPYVKRISLDAAPDIWVDALEMVGHRKRTEQDATYVNDAGYNADFVAKGLEDFYLYGKTIC